MNATDQGRLTLESQVEKEEEEEEKGDREEKGWRRPSARRGSPLGRRRRRCSRAMNYAVGRGLGPRQAYKGRGEGTLFEVVTSEIRRKREEGREREKEKERARRVHSHFAPRFSRSST